MPPRRKAVTLDSSAEALASDVLGGDRRALARAITLVESVNPAHRGGAKTLLSRVMPYSGISIRVGISGVPGVGKSSFIEVFGEHILQQDHRLAVLAVDPSSGRSGGSVLGDKTRMSELAADPRAFIRPSPAAGTLGGVARRTREAIVLCEAAGYDVVLVETVGVGQSEFAVADMTDMFVLLMLPGGGDELQGMKRGIMELADLVLVNKADGELEAPAVRAAADYANAIRLLKPRVSGWQVPVEICSVVEGKGIHEAWGHVEEFRRRFGVNGSIARRRAEQSRTWLWSEIRESLSAALMADKAVAERVQELEDGVIKGETAVTDAAAEAVGYFLKRETTPARKTKETRNEPGSSNMIGRLNHVAIVVPDLNAAAARYRDDLGAKVSDAVDLPEHGVTTVFVELPNTKIELLQPLGEDSPIAAFLERNAAGGMHHLCFEVEDIYSARDKLVASGARVLGDGEPKTGAHGKPVLFLHPKDFCGTLIEIEQA